MLLLRRQMFHGITLLMLKVTPFIGAQLAEFGLILQQFLEQLTRFQTYKAILVTNGMSKRIAIVVYPVQRLLHSTPNLRLALHRPLHCTRNRNEFVWVNR